MADGDEGVSGIDAYVAKREGLDPDTATEEEVQAAQVESNPDAAEDDNGGSGGGEPDGFEFEQGGGGFGGDGSGDSNDGGGGGFGFDQDVPDPSEDIDAGTDSPGPGAPDFNEQDTEDTTTDENVQTDTTEPGEEGVTGIQAAIARREGLDPDEVTPGEVEEAQREAATPEPDPQQAPEDALDDPEDQGQLTGDEVRRLVELQQQPGVSDEQYSATKERFLTNEAVPVETRAAELRERTAEELGAPDRSGVKDASDSG